jgi:hypothetical protein
MASMLTTRQIDIEAWLRQDGRDKISVRIGHVYDNDKGGNGISSNQSRRVGIISVKQSITRVIISVKPLKIY